MRRSDTPDAHVPWPLWSVPIGAAILLGGGIAGLIWFLGDRAVELSEAAMPLAAGVGIGAFLAIMFVRWAVKASTRASSAGVQRSIPILALGGAGIALATAPPLVAAFIIGACITWLFLVLSIGWFIERRRRKVRGR